MSVDTKVIFIYICVEIFPIEVGYCELGVVKNGRSGNVIFDAAFLILNFRRVRSCPEISLVSFDLECMYMNHSLAVLFLIR